MRRSILTSVALAAALSCLSSVVVAQPIDEPQGKELASEAMAHYKDSEFDDALDKFNQARAIYPTGQVLRMTGYTLIALGRWLEAAQTLDEALTTEFKPLLPRDAEHAQDQLDVALSHLSVAEISSSVADAKVSVDDGPARSLPATVYLEPGAHRFVVTAPEHAPVEREQDLSEGSRTRLELDPTELEPEAPVEQPKPKPKPVAPPPEEPSSAFGWFPGQGVVGLATAGVGVVFTGVAIGTGIYGSTLRSAVRDNISAHNQQYDASCAANTDSCLADIALINRDGERAQTYQNVAMGTGIAGGALIAVGATLFLFSDMSPLAPADADGDRDTGFTLGCLPTLGGGACQGTF
ncbi:MAG: hypothetical protein RIF41_05055 [Polyangiaceae bacterium]